MSSSPRSAAGIVALVVVSLLTAPEPAGADRVVLRSAADVERRPHAVGRRAPALLLVNVLRLRAAAAGRGWRVYAEDLGGLAIGFALVATLVAATALLLAL